MTRLFREEILLSGLVLLMAGVAPILFPMAQAGYANMSWLAIWVLIPSGATLMVLFLFAWMRGHGRLVSRILAGAGAGLVATFGLELIRSTGFQLGWMPGDLPQLLGVLLMDRFMEGPSDLSTLLGFGYHYWNGAVFGIVYTVLLGRKPVSWGVVYGLLIATVFLMSPAVRVTGAGFMGLEQPMMPVTVYLAHLVFGIVLGIVSRMWTRHDAWLLASSPSADDPDVRPYRDVRAVS